MKASIFMNSTGKAVAASAGQDRPSSSFQLPASNFLKKMKELFLPLLIAPMLLHAAKFGLHVDSWTNAAYDLELEQRYVESWNSVQLSYGRWNGGLQLESHEPAYPYSYDPRGTGIFQRNVSYYGDSFQLTAGHFYSMFGMGLIFRSYENRTLRLDSNLDGVKLELQRGPLEAVLLAGKPRDRAGERLPLLGGGQLKSSLGSTGQLGAAWLQSEDLDANALLRGTVFSSLYLNRLSIYTELALREKDALSGEAGQALYGSVDLFAGNFTFHGEFKDYRHFLLAQSSLYEFNAAPGAVREHLFTLLNRHQHILNADDEQGVSLEMLYGAADGSQFTLHGNSGRNHEGERLYRELYAQLERDVSHSGHGTAAAGWMEDREARFLNAAGALQWHFSGGKALKMSFEHQHVRILRDERQFYDQFFSGELSLTRDWSMGISAERSLDQTQDRQFWLGTELNARLGESRQLSLFFGDRRSGKICTGGVCVYKPEFSGFEAVLHLQL